MDGRHRPTMREAFLQLEMITRYHNVPVADQKSISEVTEETPKDIAPTPSDRGLPPYTEELYSLPSNWLINSQIQDQSIGRSS